MCAGRADGRVIECPAPRMGMRLEPGARGAQLPSGDINETGWLPAEASALSQPAVNHNVGGVALDAGDGRPSTLGNSCIAHNSAPGFTSLFSIRAAGFVPLRKRNGMETPCFTLCSRFFTKSDASLGLRRVQKGRKQLSGFPSSGCLFSPVRGTARRVVNVVTNWHKT